MPAPQKVLDLVKKFNTHEADYRAADYKEAQLRKEVIDPLFECLGWDMANTAGHAEAYKDVIHEDAIKIGGSTKAPDYCFRIGGTRKFFLEAKKPAVVLKSGSDPAYQLRRYAWSAKLPVSILTNFAEFAVYECRKKPDQHDKAAIGRVHYFTHADYADKWDEIAGIFSKEAILKGSFDKYAEATRSKRGTAPQRVRRARRILGDRESRRLRRWHRQPAVQLQPPVGLLPVTPKRTPSEQRIDGWRRGIPSLLPERRCFMKLLTWLLTSSRTRYFPSRPDSSSRCIG